MQKTLLIGNGINRIGQGSVSWDSLIEGLARESGVMPQKMVPFPMEFERIAARLSVQPSRKQTNLYDDLKGKFASLLEQQRIEPGNLHYCLRDLNANNVITTNYDLSLEKAFGLSDDQKPRVNNNGRYLTESTNTGQGVFFFHAHGVATAPKTICLGYDHYMAYIEKMGKILYPPKSDERSLTIEKKIESSELMNQMQLTWPELFFLSDVSIVGLGLDYCESDLWWLITRRASILSSNRALKEKVGVVKYYYIEIPRERPDCEGGEQETERRRQEARRAVLQDLFIKPCGIAADSYKEGYRKVIDAIKQDWSE